MKGIDRKAESIDVIAEAMFDEKARKKLSPSEAKMLEDVRAAYAMWLDKPTLTDRQVLLYFMYDRKLPRTTAMRYLYYVKVQLAHVPRAAKEWYRHKANDILDKAYDAALAGDMPLSKYLSKIAETIVKVNGLTSDEGEDIPYEKIIPPDYGFTTDPSVLGITPIPNIRERADRLLEKYSDELDEYADGGYRRTVDDLGGDDTEAGVS